MAALAVSALLVTGCGGGDSSTAVSNGEPITFRQLAQSASTSAAATSGRFSFEVTATFPGANEPFGLSGEGAFDAPSERASFAVDMSALAKLLGGFVSGLAGPNATDLPDFDDPEGWKLELVQDGKTAYVRLPALDDQLPAGKSWIRGTEGASAGGFDFSEFRHMANGDPRDVLASLRTVTSDVETVGTEELRGIETTHYRALIDPAELAKATPASGQAPSQSLVDQLTAQAGLGDMPVDVWLDANGLVRKLTMELSAAQSGSSETSRVTMAFELWDYGEPVEIEVPPASQVADASALHG
jgi:hypothetical protein